MEEISKLMMIDVTKKREVTRHFSKDSRFRYWNHLEQERDWVQEISFSPLISLASLNILERDDKACHLNVCLDKDQDPRDQKLGLPTLTLIVIAIFDILQRR